MSSPSTVQQWLGQQALPIFVIAVALLAGFAILYISARRRRSMLLRHRSARTEETFVHDLSRYGFDADIARTTYRYLQQRQNVAFPIEPMDDLDHDLGLDSDDVEQTVVDLTYETGRVHQPGLLYSPLVTVEDLVRCVQASPRHREIAA